MRPLLNYFVLFDVTKIDLPKDERKKTNANFLFNITLMKTTFNTMLLSAAFCNNILYTNSIL